MKVKYSETILIILMSVNGVFALSEDFIGMTKRIVETAPSRLQTIAQADELKAQSEGLDRRYWPQIDAQSGYQQSNSPVNVFMQRLGERNFQSSDFEINRLNHPGFQGDWGSSISMSGLIWENGSMDWQKRALEKLSQAKTLEANAIEGAILVRWSDLYLRALQTQRSIEAMRQNLKALQGDLEDAQKLESQGVTLGADVAAARAVEKSIQSRLTELDGQMASLRAQMKELVGDQIGELPVIELKPGLKPAEAVIHPSVTAARAVADAAQAHVTASRHNNDLQVKWAVGEEFHASGNADGAETTAYLGTTLNLFDPQRSSRVQAAQAERRASNAALIAAQRAQTRQHEELLAEFDSLKARLPQIEEARAQLDKSLELTRSLYKEGRKSVADVAELRQRIVESTLLRDNLRAALSGTQIALEENNGTLTVDRYLTLWE